MALQAPIAAAAIRSTFPTTTPVACACGGMAMACGMAMVLTPWALSQWAYAEAVRTVEAERAREWARALWWRRLEPSAN